MSLVYTSLLFILLVTAASVYAASDYQGLRSDDEVGKPRRRGSGGEVDANGYPRLTGRKRTPPALSDTSPSPEDPYPMIDCSQLDENQYRICNEPSCFGSEESDSDACVGLLNLYTDEEQMGSILWWCCDDEHLEPATTTTTTSRRLSVFTEPTRQGHDIFDPPTTTHKRKPHVDEQELDDPELARGGVFTGSRGHIKSNRSKRYQKTDFYGRPQNLKDIDPSLPKWVSCSSFARRSAMMCSVYSCCEPVRSTATWCKAMYKFYQADVESICYWCCDEKMVGPPLSQTKQIDSTVYSTSYHPGSFSENKYSDDGKVRLSNGLSAKPIAQSGQYVQLYDGKRSSQKFHINPDGAAIFRGKNGHYFYTSNAEDKSVGEEWDDAGVGSIEFDEKGRVYDYFRIADYTKMNCGGGPTPWNSWITCEETDSSGFGEILQTDPAGEYKAQVTALGDEGWYESFAYDNETDIPTFYVTRDADRGCLTRFTPNEKGMECYHKTDDRERWCTLEHGDLDYLIISGGPKGTFGWTKNIDAAKENAERYFRNNEGIDIVDGMLHFVSKKEHRLLILNLRDFTYTYHSTKSGAFKGQPDQVARLVDDKNSILYFCEDGGRGSGVHGRDKDGNYYEILYGVGFTNDEETTGLDFSEDDMHMYVSFQDAGIIYDVTRDDQKSFAAKRLDITYHDRDEL